MRFYKWIRRGSNEQDLEYQLKMRAERIADLNKKLAELTDQNAALTKRNDELNGTIKANMAEFNRAMKDQDEWNKMAQAMVDKEVLELKKMTENRNGWQRRANDAEAEIHRLKEANSRLQKNLADAIDEIDRLRKMAIEDKGTINSLREGLAEVERIINRLEAEDTDLENAEPGGTK